MLLFFSSFFNSDSRLLRQGPAEEVCGDASDLVAHHCHPHLHHQGRRRLLLHLRLVLHFRRVSGGYILLFLLRQRYFLWHVSALTISMRLIINNDKSKGCKVMMI